MPEPPSWIALDAARISDLRRGHAVVATCDGGGHHEVAVAMLKLRRDPSAFVTRLGHAFRRTRCGRRGAVVDARHALERFVNGEAADAGDLDLAALARLINFFRGGAVEIR